MNTIYTVRITCIRIDYKNETGRYISVFTESGSWHVYPYKWERAMEIVAIAAKHNIQTRFFSNSMIIGK